jgi:hypothetical protein
VLLPVSLTIFRWSLSWPHLTLLDLCHRCDRDAVLHQNAGHRVLAVADVLRDVGAGCPGSCHRRDGQADVVHARADADLVPAKKGTYGVEDARREKVKPDGLLTLYTYCLDLGECSSKAVP